MSGLPVHLQPYRQTPHSLLLPPAAGNRPVSCHELLRSGHQGTSVSVLLPGDRGTNTGFKSAPYFGSSEKKSSLNHLPVEIGLMALKFKFQSFFCFVTHLHYERGALKETFQYSAE